MMCMSPNAFTPSIVADKMVCLLISVLRIEFVRIERCLIVLLQKKKSLCCVRSVRKTSPILAPFDRICTSITAWTRCGFENKVLNCLLFWAFLKISTVIRFLYLICGIFVYNSPSRPNCQLSEMFLFAKCSLLHGFIYAAF
jgi:hypothetical protein